MRGIHLEVADHVVAGDPPTEAARDRQARKAGQLPWGVQAQAVVVAAPGVADVGCSIDDEGANTVLLQASCDGQAARAGSDDDDVRVTRGGLVHHEVEVTDELPGPCAQRRAGD